MTAHGQYPHEQIDGCDDYCPRPWPGHGAYAHERNDGCDALCSETGYSSATEDAAARWDDKELRRWRQRPTGGVIVDVVPCDECDGRGYHVTERTGLDVEGLD